jgi:TonB-linked SusC/RagA family outer membrane protein
MKHLSRLISLLSAALVFALNGYCQGLELKGTVTLKGSPLAGATVSSKNSSSKTTTNDAGTFTLQVAKLGETVVVTYIGMETKEIVARSVNLGNIEMAEKIADAVDGVVVVGYGTQLKRNVTSSIGTVSGKDLREVVAPGLDQALAGRVAGVQVTKNTGAPGGGINIRVRGTASLFGGQEPLYVVDGVPINNTPTGSADVLNSTRGGVAGNEVLNPISQIPIEEIESIEILKDAASAGIYGARAANGVVMVTTKKGRPGRLEVTVGAYYGINDIPKNRRYNMLDGPTFAEAVNLTRAIRNLPPTFADPKNVASTNWQEEVLQNGAVQNYNVGISGGSDKIRTSFGASYFNQSGTIIATEFERFSFRNNTDFILSEKVRLGANILYSRSISDRLRNSGNGFGTDNFNNNNLYGPSVLSSALIANPTYKPYTDGGLYNLDTLNNTISPIATAKEVDLVSTDDRTIGNLYLEYQPIKGLKLRTNIGADLRNSYEEYFTKFVPGVFNGAGTGASLETGIFREWLWLNENYASYDFKIKSDHNISTLAGFSMQESKNNGLSARVRNIPSNDLQNISAGTQILALKEQGFQYWGILSYFGRVNYNYKGKYLFSGTFRRDGSSRFGPDRRYGNFPAASVGWIISDENFMKNLRAVTLLKLRGSYGKTGNDQIGNVWTWLASMAPLPGATSYLQSSGSFPTSIQIGDFGWETTNQLDIGVDLQLWNGKIGFVADYYKRTTKDLLYGISLPSTTGFTSVTNNLGNIENQGWEFSLNTRNVTKKHFTWSSNFNISFNKNKLLNLYEGRTQDSYGDFGKATLLKVGEPISWQGVRVTGINSANGDFLVQDQDGDGVITDADMVVLGSPLPKHFGGFNNNLSFYNFDVNIFFTWSYGNLIMNNTRSFLETTGIPTNNATIQNTTRERWEGRWQKPGDVVKFRGFDPGNTYTAVGSRPSDFYLEDGSHIKLRTFSLGYNLPKHLLAKLKMQAARFYVNGNNLFIITDYSGYDPEVNHNNLGTNITIGYDNGTYPQGRSFVFGLNLTF